MIMPFDFTNLMIFQPNSTSAISFLAQGLAGLELERLRVEGQVVAALVDEAAGDGLEIGLLHVAGRHADQAQVLFAAQDLQGLRR